MRYDPRDFPLPVSAIQKGRRNLVVAVDGSDRIDRLAVRGIPEGMDEDRIRAGIETAEALDLDNEGPYCEIDGAVIRFEHVPTGVRIPVAAPWRTLRVTGFAGDDVLMDIDGHEGRFTLAGDGQTPLSAVTGAFRETFPVGTPMTFRQDMVGVVSDVRHPDPLIDTMTLAVLDAMGIGVGHLREIALPHARVIGSSEIGIIMNDGVPMPAPENGQAEDPGIRIHCEDGVMTGSVLRGKVLYDHGEVILLDTEIPETAIAALTGRRLSEMFDTGFPHPDPVIMSIRCAAGETVVRCRMETRRLSACGGE